MMMVTSPELVVKPLEGAALNPIDNIRLSDINVRLNALSQEQIIIQITNTFALIDAAYDQTMTDDIVQLIGDCYSKNSNEISMAVLSHLTNPTKSPIHLLISSLIASIEYKLNGPAKIPDYLVQCFHPTLKSISDSLLSSSNLIISGFTFSPTQTFFLASHILMSIAVTLEILSPLIPFLFPEPHRRDRTTSIELVSHLSSNDLLSLVPESYYAAVDIVPSLYEPILSSMPQDIFIRHSDTILMQVLVSKSPSLAISYLKHAIISSLLIPQNLVDILPLECIDFIDYLSKFPITLPQRICDSISDFSRSSYFICILPEPQKYISDSVISAFINSNPPGDVLAKVLKAGFRHPILSDFSLWNTMIQKLLWSSFDSASQCFAANSFDVVESASKVLQLSNPPNPSVCTFLTKVISTTALKLQFTRRPFLVQYLKSFKQKASLEFWQFVGFSEPIIEALKETDSPILHHGLAVLFSCFPTSTMSISFPINTLAKETVTDLTGFASSEYSDNAEFYNSQMSLDSLTIAANASIFSSNIIQKQNLPTIEGLTSENVILFVLLAYQSYTVNCSTSSTPLFMSVFGNSSMHALLIEAVKPPYSPDRKTQIKALLSFICGQMQFLSLFLSFMQKLRPLVTILYEAMDKSFMNELGRVISYFTHFSVSPTSLLRRQVLVSEGFITPIGKEPSQKTIASTRKEEKEFISSFGDTIIEFLSKVSFDSKEHVDLSVFEESFVKKTLQSLIDSNLTKDLIVFLESNCRGVPKLTTNDSQKVVELLESAIAAEDWKHTQNCIAFMVRCSLKEAAMPYFDRNLPAKIVLALASVFADTDIEGLRKAISTNYIISILIASPRLYDSIANSFIDLVLSDEETSINCLFFELEQIPRSFVLTTHTACTLCRASFKKNPKLFAKAVYLRYESPDELPETLIRRAEPIKPPNPSEYCLGLMKAFIKASTTKTSWAHYSWILELANSRPFLFNCLKDKSVERVFRRTFKSLKEFLGVLEDQFRGPTSLKLSISIILFIFIFIMIPRNCDLFFVWLEENINGFDQSQFLSSILIIRTLLQQPTIKVVTASVLVSKGWIGKIVDRMGNNSIIQTQVLGLILDYCAIFLNASPSTLYCIESLSRCQKPFQDSMDDTLSMRKYCTPKSPISQIESLLTKPEILFTQLLFTNRLLKKEKNDVNSIILRDLLIEMRPSVGDLPDRYYCTYLHETMPEIPELTPEMDGFLSTQPNWVGEWIKSPSTVLLMADHYQILTDVINKLSKVENREISSEKIVKWAVCQKPIADALLSAKVKELSSDVLKLLGTNASSRDFVVSSILSDLNSEVLQNALAVLANMSQSKDFKAGFDSQKAESLLRIVSSPLVSELSLKYSATILLNVDFPKTLSFEIFLMSLLLSSNVELFSLCLKLSSSMPLKSHLSFFFKILVGKWKKGEPSDFISDFLSYNPSFAAENRGILLSLFETILKNFAPQYTKASIALISLLQPKIPPFSEPTDQSIIPTAVFDISPDFWKLIVDNKDSISKLVDQSPNEPSLAFVQKFPGLLSFEMKYKLFCAKQKEKITNRSISISIDRKRIIEDSFSQLHEIQNDQFLGIISVQFVGENGLDLGGIRRDWFCSLIKELLDPNYALFSPVGNGRSFAPSPSSSTNPDHLKFFYFTGRVIARAIVGSIQIPAHLSTTLLKSIIGMKVGLNDLATVDETLFNSLKWILENSVEGADLRFSIEYEDIGVRKVTELKKGGDSIVVNDSNKEEYVRLSVQKRLIGQTESQIKSFLNGFRSIIPEGEMRMFTPSEADLIICGIPKVDINDLRKECKYVEPYNEKHPVIVRFFSVVKEWTNEKLAKLLLFVTGSSQVPIGGFKAYKDSGIPFTIAPGGGGGRLPVAHTCTNTLDLPEYTNVEVMADKLLFSISECNTFGFV